VTTADIKSASAAAHMAEQHEAAAAAAASRFQAYADSDTTFETEHVNFTEAGYDRATDSAQQADAGAANRLTKRRCAVGSSEAAAGGSKRPKSPAATQLRS
jgi:hypothetical protein